MYSKIKSETKGFLTFRTTNAIVKTLGLRIETILVAQAATVRKSPAFPLSLDERPLVNVLLARSWLGFHQASVRERSLRRSERVHFVGQIDLRRVGQIRRDDRVNVCPNEDPEDPSFLAGHRCFLAEKQIKETFLALVPRRVLLKTLDMLEDDDCHVIFR